MTHSTPTWAIAPFGLYLLLIATLPLFFGAFWEHNRNKFIVAAVVSAPVLVYLFSGHGGGAEELLRTAVDYVSFIALLGALFTISGGIHLRGSLAGSSGANTLFLAIGAILGSVIGTTGASVLLIRPLLRANERRGYTTHIVVFFIFIVSNAAGLLTPLGHRRARKAQAAPSVVDRSPGHLTGRTAAPGRRHQPALAAGHRGGRLRHGHLRQAAVR